MKLKTLSILAAWSLPLCAANINVPNGGNLQAALNAAQPGDTITLAAGASFVGHYYLAPNPSTQAITIQSSAMGSLPGPGNRVSSGNASAMPKLISADGAPALTIPSGANNYKIQGIEFAPASGVYAQDLIQVGTGTETSVGALPHDIDLDRLYIHGDPSAGSKRGVALNGAGTTVENSYISGFISTWQDTQALAGWNGSGPFNIVNNYLEAGTEIVAFGGTVPTIPGLVPSDIVVRNNNFFKPLSWMRGSSNYAGIPVWAKNHIELKNAQRMTIDSNTFENNWVGADQQGFMFVFQVRTEYGAVPWATVNNITVTNNTIRHSGAGALFGGRDGSSSVPGNSSSFNVKNNMWNDISGNWGSDGRLFIFSGGISNITFDHNTAFETGFLGAFDDGRSSNINFTNNIFLSGGGLIGNSTNVGTATLNYWDQGGAFSNNIVVGADPKAYPSNNFFPSTISAVGFVDLVNGNYLLSSTSPYLHASTDGSSLGSSVGSNTSAAPAPAPAPSSTLPNGWVKLVSKSSGKCLDVLGSSLLPGTITLQWSCSGNDNQKFQFVPVGGGYEITARQSGLQLDVLGSLSIDGTAIVQYPFWGGANQIWTVNPTSDGYYTISANNSGKCMDVNGSSTLDGTAVTQWSCTGTDNQKWSIVP
jgi:Ricin-type beta-trefoil lectin domain